MEWLQQLRAMMAQPQANPAVPELRNSHGGSLVSGAVQGAYSGLTLPRDVYEGRVDPRSDEALQRTWDMIGMMGGGATAVGKPAGSIGMMAGREARYAPKPDLDAAQGAAARGASTDDIWRGHGVDVTHPDTKPRWEISDDQAKWNPNWLQQVTDRYTSGHTAPLITRVDSALDHPELWANYPEIGAMPLKVGDPAGLPKLGTSHGYFQGSWYNPNTPGMDPGYIALNGGHIAGSPTGSGRNTMLHELQHAVQQMEGFAGGVSPSRIGKQAEQAMQARMYELMQKGAGDPANMAEIQRLGKIYGAYQGDPRTRSAVNFNLYRRNPGEAEARNTGARQWMSPDERAVTMPWQTLPDVDRNDLIMTPEGFRAPWRQNGPYVRTP